MPLDEADSSLFKAWTIKKLESISDADSEVLADYVLALVRTDDSEAAAKANCTENLKDFIGDSAESFVDEVFRAIATKSYDPSRPSPKPTAPIYHPPRRADFEAASLPNESRKRSYLDWDAEGEGSGSGSGRILSYESGERPVKHARRSRGGYGHEQRDGGRQWQQPAYSYGAVPPIAPGALPMQLPPLPTPPPGMPAAFFPPGMPAFDPSDPMAALMAMGQAMGLLPSTSGARPPAIGNGYGHAQRCRDYDRQGFCTRGASCPYEHGEDPFVVPQQDQEYDPNNATMFEVPPTRAGHFDASPQYRGRGRGSRARGSGATPRGGRQRADFSMVGTNNDRSSTSIVVEQIPEDKFTEQDVRDFFTAFGNVENVTLQPYKRLAIIKYDTHGAAQAAYDSHKSVFDNRFVKVYWYKPKTLPQPPTNGHAPAPAAPNGFDTEMDDAEPEIDYEEVARRQEEAQRKHDETKRQREAALAQRQELDEKLRAINNERRKTAALLAAKTGVKAPSPAPGDADADDEDDEQTRILKAQLAELQSEAKSLGIDPDAEESWSNGYASFSPYRGRGSGYRGRRGRGYHQASYQRGNYHSYNGYHGYGARGGSSGGGGARLTHVLDNRPKTIVVNFAEGTGGYAQHEEALRQYLMFNGLETAVLSKHPAREDAACIAFQQRFEGENFLGAAVGEGPLGESGLLKQLGGRVEMGWFKPEEGSLLSLPINGSNGAAHADGERRIVADAGEVREGAAIAGGGDCGGGVEQVGGREERDMDTYDEVD